jgi:hypothetical protein
MKIKEKIKSAGKKTWEITKIVSSPIVEGVKIVGALAILMVLMPFNESSETPKNNKVEEDDDYCSYCGFYDGYHADGCAFGDHTN